MTKKYTQNNDVSNGRTKETNLSTRNKKYSIIADLNNELLLQYKLKNK